MSFLRILAAAGCVVASMTAASAAPAKPAASRLEKLSRGANVSRWFQAYGADDSHYATYLSDDEIAMIRKLGLRHVRLCVTPGYLYNPAEPDKPIEEHLTALRAAILRFHAHDLAVVLDPHNTDRKVEADAQWTEGYPVFWGALAAKLSDISPEKLFFEVINEPVYDGKDAEWFALQEKIVAAIRKSAPDHTIIATGPNWGGVGGLLKMTPLEDKNIVYSFHFYDPFTFTHQGATWAGRVPPLLKDVPYPSSPEAVADVLSKTTDAEARGWIEDYGKQRWNRDHLKQRLAEALDWGKKNGVPLYCGEFGVFPVNASPESRRNWYRDYASVLKESGVGYSVWAWDDIFGFGRKLENGKPVIDMVPVEALGLKKP